MPRSYRLSYPGFDQETYYEWRPPKVSVSTYQRIGKYRARTFNGTRTPNYKSLRESQGWLPTQPCTDIVEEQDPITREYVRYNSSGLRAKYLAQTLPDGPSVRPYSFSSDIDECWSKARQKLLAKDFDAAVFLAEGHKTVQMIAATAVRLSKFARHLRRGDFVRASRTLGITHTKGMSNNWLEYKYGWLPLLSDAHDAATALAKSVHGPRRKTMVVSARVMRNFSYDYSNTRQVTDSAVTKVWYRVAPTGSNAVKALNSLGLLNPLTVAWELCPFSFVADWFVNIGDCLAELTAFVGWDVLDGGSSTLRSVKGYTLRFAPAYYSDPPTLGGTFLYREYRRSPGVQMFPRLRLKHAPLSLARITTAASLLRQRI